MENSIKYLIIVVIATAAVLSVAIASHYVSNERGVRHIDVTMPIVEETDEITDDDIMTANYNHVQDAIDVLIHKYDGRGLDGLTNNDFIVNPAEFVPKYRFLYIVDLDEGVVGYPTESLGLNLKAIPPLEEGKSIWIGYDGASPTSTVQDITQQVYFKMHEGLVFISGFPVNEHGLVEIDEWISGPEITMNDHKETGNLNAVLESCECHKRDRLGINDGLGCFAVGLEYQNETHHINNNSCQWYRVAEPQPDHNGGISFDTRQGIDFSFTPEMTEQQMIDFCQSKGLTLVSPGTCR